MTVSELLKLWGHQALAGIGASGTCCSRTAGGGSGKCGLRNQRLRTVEGDKLAGQPPARPDARQTPGRATVV